MNLDRGAYDPSATVLVSGVTAIPASCTPKVAINALSTLKSDTMGGKSARLDVVNIVSRVERSAYNLVRLCSLWHHALNNENIILD